MWLPAMTSSWREKSLSDQTFLERLLAYGQTLQKHRLRICTDGDVKPVRVYGDHMLEWSYHVNGIRSASRKEGALRVRKLCAANEQLRLFAELASMAEAHKRIYGEAHSFRDAILASSPRKRASFCKINV